MSLLTLCTTANGTAFACMTALSCRRTFFYDKRFSNGTGRKSERRKKNCTRYERNLNAIAKCISGDGSDCAEENRVAHTKRIRFCEFNLRANIHATFGLNSIFVQHSTLSSGILLRSKRFEKWPSSSDCAPVNASDEKGFRAQTTHQYSFGAKNE